MKVWKLVGSYNKQSSLTSKNSRRRSSNLVSILEIASPVRYLRLFQYAWLVSDSGSYFNFLESQLSLYHSTIVIY